MLAAYPTNSGVLGDFRGVLSPVAAWPGGPGGAPTHLPLYDVGRHGHRRAPGVRSMYYQALALDQSSDVIVINLD